MQNIYIYMVVVLVIAMAVATSNPVKMEGTSLFYNGAFSPTLMIGFLIEAKFIPEMRN